MKIDCFVLGAYQSNSYVLRLDETSTGCIIIDTGLDGFELVDFLRDNSLDPLAVILTHGHIDHIAALDLLRDQFPSVRVYIHEFDAPMLTGDSNNLAIMLGKSFVTRAADVLLSDGDIVEVAGIKLSVLHTPGHTPGGICLYSKAHEVAFVGDTLFAESIGRADFPGGDMAALIASIKDRLFKLPEQTKLYPGHGPATTIAHEKTHNPFLQ